MYINCVYTSVLNFWGCFFHWFFRFDLKLFTDSLFTHWCDRLFQSLITPCENAFALKLRRLFDFFSLKLCPPVGRSLKGFTPRSFPSWDEPLLQAHAVTQQFCYDSQIDRKMSQIHLWRKYATSQDSNLGPVAYTGSALLTVLSGLLPYSLKPVRFMIEHKSGLLSLFGIWHFFLHLWATL